ncbi:MAG: sulfotransferase [Bacteroidia bacterium]|nr:sulfotransferase [Bacteroidia bacterium]
MLEKLNRKSFIIVVGRANSGTRIIPQVLNAAGVYVGEPLNVALDLLPVDDIYAACRIFGPEVKYLGRHNWDFTRVCEMEIPPEFLTRLENYLAPLIQSESEFVAWKIPNNNLIYPWLTRIFPQASFIHWMRNPEGNCIKMMGIDRLEKWNIKARKYYFHEWNYKMRAVSWKYHFDIVNDTPRPQNFLQIRFEDYVLQQEKTRPLVSEFVGLELEPVELKASKAGPWSDKYYKRYPFLRSAMDKLGYK